MDFNEIAETTHTLRTIRWVEKYRQREQDLPGWMSTFREGHSCVRLTETHLAGSFNFCLPFEYDDGVKWILRFAVPGRSMDPDGKLLREVAVMKHVQAKTNIPVPKIHFWGLSQDNSLELGPFIIMDYVEGLKLGDLWKEPSDAYTSRRLRKDISDRDLRLVFAQMARFYLELYKLRFEEIGSLVLDDDGKVALQGPPHTWKMQEIEAHSGVKVGVDRSEAFSSSTSYFRWATEHDWKHLNEQPNSVDNAEDARSKYIFNKLFYKAIPHFVAPEHETAPFGLVCDDMRYGNMLVNNEHDLQIVAVIDWEWSYTAPLQLCYSPPRALLGKLPYQFWEKEPHCEMERYTEFYGKFLDELKRAEEEQVSDDRSTDCKGEERLSVLMQRSMDDGKFWFNEIILSCYMEGNNLPWKKLCQQFPELGNSDDLEEEEIVRFVEERVKWREMYDENERRIAENQAAKKLSEAQETGSQSGAADEAEMEMSRADAQQASGEDVVQEKENSGAQERAPKEEENATDTQ
ncbi:kinase-like domain-containing protein [Phyllosticta capitalensis]|uniref:kinase-like domain-containing protein n=1 Tax=Phyllosticta capitalensis TaxID=121624 RepID=UPI00312F0C50